MYAIIQTGGKQYRVAPGTKIDIERLKADKNAPIEFKEILFVSDGSNPIVGSPVVNNFVVRGEFIEDSKGPKVVGMKYKQRNRRRRKFGHRQHYWRVEIKAIEKIG